MAKMNLKRSYRMNGAAFGPGDNVEVPDDVAKKIRQYQKEFEGDERESRATSASQSEES